MKELKDKAASPALRPVNGPRQLLDRILETSHLAHVIPRLAPQVIHRVIQTCGLEDCGELLALATPAQLAAVLELDLWRPAQPGMDEQFDADRFGLWLEVMMESGAAVATQRLAEMDVNLAIAGFAQHVRVFDPATVSLTASTDGDLLAVSALDDGVCCEVGGYLVVARCSDAWDAIVAMLTSLDADHHDYFHRLMRGCRNFSNSSPEIDGLEDLLPIEEQTVFDLAFSRERRRDRQGYVTPAQARAFLQMSRQIRLGHDTPPTGNPVARAYFRAIESPAPLGTDANRESGGLSGTSDSAPTLTDGTDAIAAIVDVLTEAGVLPQQPRALLAGSHGDAPRLARLQAQMQFARDRDQAAHSMRTAEFAYLANTIAVGCSIQARTFTVREASDAAAAVCNLGLENWPIQWLAETPGVARSAVDAGTTLPEDFLVHHDLISVFQVGWTVLHSNVSMYAAEQLIHALTALGNDDSEVQAGLDALQIEITKRWRDGTPWRARDALDVIVVLDMPAWATLLGLIDECPVIHAALATSRDARTRAISASSFEFISENRQIASVHAFMESLAKTLGP